jgi:hypothetical protein
MSAIMRLMPSCSLALWVTCVLVVELGTARAETIDFGRYHALVIGNNDYEHWTPLTTAVRDADEVAELLESKYGFKVELLENATRSEIVRALNRLRGELTEVDNLLIYYAGHGNLDGDVGFWIGVDGDKNFEDSWVSVSTITRNLSHMSARHVLVVADSCYSGTLTRGDDDAGLRTGHKRSAWLERMTHKRARLALTSGGVEPVSDVGGSGHSVFAKEFLEALRENDDVLEGQALFGQIKEDVVVNANQTPDYGKIRLASDEGGDFLFVPRDVQIAVQAEQQDFGPQRGAGEELGEDFKVWSMIQNSPNPVDFQTFIETFPDSVLVQFAHGRLDQIEKELAAPTPPAQEASPSQGIAEQQSTVKPEETLFSDARVENDFFVFEDDTVRTYQFGVIDAKFIFRPKQDIKVLLANDWLWVGDGVGNNYSVSKRIGYFKECEYKSNLCLEKDFELFERGKDVQLWFKITALDRDYYKNNRPQEFKFLLKFLIFRPDRNVIQPVAIKVPLRSR